MRQYKLFRQTRRLTTPQLLLAIFLGAVMLLAVLVMATGWGTARAAPQSGGPPTLTILNANGYVLTLEFDSWASGTTITLGYSPANLVEPCKPHSTQFQPPLPDATLQVSTSNAFQKIFTWPSTLEGSYYLCASYPADGGTFPSLNSFQVTSTGILLNSPTPSPSPPPKNTTPGTTASPTTSSNPKITPTPGTGGVSITNSDNSTLIAIIVLCVLVLILLLYLVRLWLRRQQTRTP